MPKSPFRFNGNAYIAKLGGLCLYVHHVMYRCTRGAALQNTMGLGE